jgi:hypothetical protein
LETVLLGNGKKAPTLASTCSQRWPITWRATVEFSDLCADRQTECRP